MKKIFLLPLIILFVAFSSCDQDESLDPRPVVVAGQFLRLDITKKRMNFDDINNTSFEGVLSDPSGNVAKYNLYVRKTNIYGQAGEFVLFKTFTSFPADLKVTPAGLATALDVPLTSLVFGDKFRFYGETFDANNVRVDYYSLSPTVQTAIYLRQAYRFVTDLTNNDGMRPLDLIEYDNYTAQ
ncbi:hypothetical protein FNO01nite_00240 [Flavobacterium noncentrifugens]|uniref:Uncharacterized protein n=1 Tax=Flavobacterium noncentrifugens TaxID=1128970 RepID=A0A1G8RA13_9FLAO|nr:hypothetical protein [Flavobacterium noncentrifugens]GEP49352.1 hypothetical protein FNO01nite_00240 [Flavobacterium noncentrifugens]SDJ13798.1 hypothetical protein SAMN04487935_0032 [Flavobacterium noncentrifugens]